MGRVVFGIHPVREALKSDAVTVERVLVRKGARSVQIGEILDIAKEIGVRVRAVETEELNRLCEGGNHQSVAASVSEFAYTDLDDWLGASPVPRPDILALDQVQDPHNLGALIRTAEGLGMGAVLIPKDRSASVDAVVMKASAGAAAYMPICRVTNLARSLESLKEQGYWVVGMDAEAGTSLYATPLSGPLVLVLGSEGSGLRPLVARQCDYRLALPREGRVQSFNVSVAGAIVMAELWRRRHAGGPETRKGRMDSGG